MGNAFLIGPKPKAENFFLTFLIQLRFMRQCYRENPFKFIITLNHAGTLVLATGSSSKADSTTIKKTGNVDTPRRRFVLFLRQKINKQTIGAPMGCKLDKKRRDVDLSKREDNKSQEKAVNVKSDEVIKSRVQIYSYNGWKFEESHIDFTGHAFGAGVVRLRAFDHIINETTTIVIANQDSFDETWNVYTALYETANDSTKLHESISKWCVNAQERLYSFNVDDTNNVLNSVLSIQ
ncbi:CLUMA_CG003047, isoform A [Clunio marinus]|uniref:CLUMA_CG003047, isoform A n=1 Tax=Clunio marinus TaxID=568069 RepID=A0A1J1HMJ6_9DIPT|nr:CLUMA_CG003047, isoform A [Clunio marinus]